MHGYDDYKLASDRDHLKSETTNLVFDLSFPEKLQDRLYSGLSMMLDSVSFDLEDEEGGIKTIKVDGLYSFEYSSYFDDDLAWDSFYDFFYYEFKDVIKEIEIHRA